VTLERLPVLVTGGEGFIGNVLTEHLRDRGAAVRVLVRDPVSLTTDRDRVVGDVTLAASLADAVRGCEVVFHCAAAGGGPLAHARAVNVEGTRNLLEAALQAGTVRRVVHLSSVAVHGPRLPAVVSEDQPFCSAGDAYSMTKAQAEVVARSYNGRAALEVVVVRPTCVYGPRSTTWVLAPFKRIRDEQVLLVGSGAGLINLIYVTDLVELLLLAATSPRSPGQVFIGSGVTPVTWSEYLNAFAAMQGKPCPPTVSVYWAFVLAHAYLWRFRFTRKPGRLSPGDLRQHMNRSVFSIGKARELIGFEPRVTFNEGIKLTEAWLRETGYLS
jgi:nucleoside-diphosphate-sugar epimerase